MIGQTVSHYRIEAKIGKGGMGEVYLAEDTSLPRRVALKFLPASVADDELARKRFLREAASAASLDHPFICHIHEVVRHGSQDVIVMEYVEGDTLLQKLAEGSLPLQEALQIVAEIAEALEEAHRKGIVHRDLKPSNIMLTMGGHAKVMDFGLAKKVGGQDGAGQEITTALTREGTTLGTLAYMSPEQVKAEEVDHRSDIFSLGVILYEMLTGFHPFRKARQAETIAAILKEEPVPLAEFTREPPELLQHTVRKMLAKLPVDRYQSVHEVQTDLKAIAGEQKVTEQRAPRPVLWAGGAALLIVIAGLVGVALWWSPWSPERTPRAPLKVTPFTTDGSVKRLPRFSPDGERVAYSWDGPTRDNFDIYVKGLGVGSEPNRLTDEPAEDLGPAWSPDGRQIAFTRFFPDGTGAIYVIPSLGGRERKLVDLEGVTHLQMGYPLGIASWSPDGDSLIFSESDIPQGPARMVGLSIDTLRKKDLTTPPKDSLGDLFPQFSPDGSRVAFLRVDSQTAMKEDLWVQSLDGGAARRLTELEAFGIAPPAWTADGRSILFAAYSTLSSSQLWQVDLESRRLDAVAGVGQGVGFVSVWRHRLVFAELRRYHRDIYRVPIRPEPRAEPELLIGSAYNDWNADVSTEGRQIVFESNRSGKNAIWKCRSDGSKPLQLTVLEGFCGTPRWSPDGKRILFDSNQSGNWDLWLMDSEGGVPHQLTNDLSDENQGTWSRDGRWIYFTSARTGRNEIFKMPAEGGKPVQLTRDGGWYALESTDGKSVYYTRQSEPGLWRLPTSGQGESIHMLSQVRFTNWAVGDRGIYFAAYAPQDYRIQFYDLKSGETTELYRRQGAFDHPGLAVSPDEKWLLFGEVPWPEAELMLAENFH